MCESQGVSEPPRRNEGEGRTGEVEQERARWYLKDGWLFRVWAILRLRQTLHLEPKTVVDKAGSGGRNLVSALCCRAAAPKDKRHQAYG